MSKIDKIRSQLSDTSEGLKSGGGAEALVAKLTLPSGWGVPISDIVDQVNVRMDAEHYDPRISRNMDALHKASCDLRPLSDLADIQLPSMFTRIWAEDAEHGIPYLNATDLMSYGALGEPAQERFLSRASNVKMGPLILSKGMVLITCSGTIGRVFEVPSELDGWVGTHDIVRIIPHNKKHKGFIRAFLSSEYAQIQILSNTHGGQIDHITGDQVGSCLVPNIGDEKMIEISKQMDKAETMKQKATKLMKASLGEIREVLGDV